MSDSTPLPRTHAMDLRLYLVVGPENCLGRPLGEVVEAAARGGVTLVQYRNKTGGREEILKDLAALKQGLAPYGVPLLLNDHVELAHEAAIDGVHIGQSDLPPEEARAALGPDAIIGQTVKTRTDIAKALQQPLDYISIGAVYPTQTKKNAEPPLGPEGLRELVTWTREQSKMALTAIAGINAERVAAVMASGIDGVALVTAITHADDPESAARELRRLVDMALEEGSGE